MKFHDLDQSIIACAQLNKIKAELSALKLKYFSLEQSFHNLKLNYDLVKRNNTVLWNSLASMINTSSKFEKEISYLKQLSTIQPLDELKIVNKTIQTLKTQTNALEIKEQA